MKIYDLPTCIFDLLQSYLIIIDKRNNISSRQFLYLLSTTKKFRQIRFETLIIYLRNTSDYFLRKKDVHQFILQKVANPKNQLKIFVSDVWHLYQMNSWLPTFTPYQYTTQYDEAEPYVLEDITSPPHRLILSGMNSFTRINSLEKIGFLNELIICSNYSFFDSYEGPDRSLTDVSNFNYLYLKKVKMSDCVSLQDIRPLNKIQDLTLVSCHSIGNPEIQELQENDRITIHTCEGITIFKHCFRESKSIEIVYYETSLSPIVDITSFQHVEILVCKHVSFQNKVSTLKGENNNHDNKDNNVQKDFFQFPATMTKVHLKFVGGGNIFITDVNVFHYLTNVCIDECSITTVATLGNVRILTLNKLTLLSSLEGLGKKGQVKVMLSMLRSITDFSPLKKVKVVTIDSCLQFANVSEVSEVEDLTITNCKMVENVTAASKCNAIRIKDCPGLTSLHGLEHVPVVYLSNCTSLKSAEGLGNNDKIVFQGHSFVNQLTDLTSILGDRYTIFRGFNDFEKMYLRNSVTS